MSRKVLILYGGLSSEREVSIRSGKAISKGLKEAGFIVKEFDFKGKLENVIEEFRPDVVFIALHGKFGEDGSVQGALELLGVPYTGSGVMASAVCMDKLITKRLFTSLHIRTADFLVLKKGERISFNNTLQKLNTNKVVIKPIDQGSTIGITITDNAEEFDKGIHYAFSLSDVLVIEKFIKGKEITVSVIGNNNSIRLFPVIEIVPERSFYDFESKYVIGMSHHIIPAHIPQKSYKKAEEIAYKVYREFNLRDFARIDCIVDKEGEVFALEANTIPGFTETSLFPDAAKAAGIPFSALTGLIVNEVIKRGG